MSRKILKLISLFLLVSCNAYKAHNLYKTTPAFFSYSIGNACKKPHIKHANEAYVTPASCQKTVTALLAYKILGSDYRYKTSLYTSNNTKDLIISFSGDPTLTSEDLYNLLKSYSNKKFNKIIVNAVYYQTPTYSPNVMLSDMGSSYLPPIASTIIDHNLISVEITNNTNKCKISSEPKYKIKSNLKLSDNETNITTTQQGNHIILDGILNKNEGKKKIVISPLELNYYIKTKVRKVINSLNIDGHIVLINKIKNLPKNQKLIKEHLSDCLCNFLPPAFKKSDNLVFDSLYLTILNKENPIYTWNETNKLIKPLIAKHLGVDIKDAVIVDGSGVSRYNKMQTNSLYQILQDGLTCQDFINSFPYPGEKESSLVKRNNLPKGIRAKTGTLSGISCLCGYNNLAKSPQIFVVNVSNFGPDNKTINTLIDSFLSKELSK